MTERAALIDRFLASAGFGAAKRLPLPGDASFRHYVRLTGGPEPALLMDAPPDREDVRPFVAVAEHLAALGFSAPRILASSLEDGLVIVEDFGDATFTRLLAKGADERALYKLAIDTLIALHRLPSMRTTAINVPPYDDERLLAEAGLLPDWYAPAALGGPLPPRAVADYETLWRAAFPLARKTPETLVLRDFHVDNLMRLAGREDHAACGLLDFQDAVIGPTAYDLVSLLEDARRDLAPGLKEAMTERYLAAFPALDRNAFVAASAVLAAQRNAKIVGIFIRLWKRDGKPVYLKHIPRVWRLLEADLAHPALEGLRTWFDAYVPAELRRAPRADAVESR
ncbi:MAG TPA: phosphotransferase [Alphaproteobacteria bacterium]|nr:phosphotransferase [Alphaproteobacteria bacterium]